jgi:hypothetical protein
LAIVDAQREYAVDDLDGNGSNDYARRFVSSEGKRDGLFWPVEANEQPSPLGPLVGAATREGYVSESRQRAADGVSWLSLPDADRAGQGCTGRRLRLSAQWIN